MAKSLSRTDKEIAEIYKRHVRTVYRVCFAYMKNSADAEDAVSETFLRMIKAGTEYESEEHEKAWLLRAASNVCKNMLKHWWRKNKPLEDAERLEGEENIKLDGVLETVLDLPEKYKTVVYLYYYEGYTGAEIADILHKPQSTVRNYLREARIILKNKLGEDFYE